MQQMQEFEAAMGEMSMNWERVAEEWQKMKPQIRRNGKTFWTMVDVAITKEIKRIPQRVNYELGVLGTGQQYLCGQCNALVSNYTYGKLTKYCWNCGGAIEFGYFAKTWVVGEE